MEKVSFDTPTKNDKEICEQITEMGRNNDYTTGTLLTNEYVLKHCKLIATDLSKQIELENLNLKQINFIGRLERNEGATMFFIIENQKKQLLNLNKILQPLFHSDHV